MKNLKKLEKKELKAINGGDIIEIPMGCDRWDFRARCCKEWDAAYSGNRTC
ncbi:bacteriocin-like protein [Chryseobacterium jejuense]|uniref:Bacteriocin-type signal sequence-containing protein n=1 Tax=Chryseobacterium jejuense TaxID=445960 RepID=A0A2X2VH79_CHRJE|nr:bacteriocin [Chryseobacterium jejuense]SDJ20686.1 bacteriocin-type signal sequence-containing protein [Chryseobacterium jejuense]SQB28516.1 Uncharacterised protein [Chryseobacterium jejuense]